MEGGAVSLLGKERCGKRGRGMAGMDCDISQVAW